MDPSQVFFFFPFLAAIEHVLTYYQIHAKDHFVARVGNASQEGEFPLVAPDKPS
jgi:hypothetical protein